MDKVLIQTTWGPTDPTRAGFAITCAVMAEAEGMDVAVFLFHDAVLLANKKMCPKVIPIGPPPVSGSIEYLIDNNVKIYVCRPCYEFRGLSPDDLIPTAELKGMELFVELAKDRKVISF
jgi:predicted peroxiredoxin